MASNGERWQDGKSLAACNKYMLTNSVSTDVTFIVGENRKQVLAHKYVLGSRSSVFYAMLFGPMAESSAITIPDIEPDVFQEILRHLYYEESIVTPANVTSLTLAADKYAVTGVIMKCREYLLSTFSVENVSSILEYASQFHDEKLKAKCLEFIFLNCGEVLQSPSFFDLNPRNLKLIVNSDELSADEGLVYRSVKKWAETRCKLQNKDSTDKMIRKEFEDVIKMVRFPLISFQYFATVVSKENILTLDEKIQIFQCYFDKDIYRNIQFCETRQRTVDEQVCMRGSKFTKLDWEYGIEPDRIDLTVSESVKMTGFVMCASDQSVEYDIEAKVIKTSDVIEVIKTKVSTPPGEKTYRIRFNTGVYLYPGIRYTVSVKVLGTRSYFAIECQSAVTSGGVTFRFLTASHPNNGTCSSYGQIPGIIFTRLER